MKGIATDFFLCLPVICLLVRPGIFYAKLGIFILQFWGFLAYKKQTGHYVKCVGLTPIVFLCKTTNYRRKKGYSWSFIRCKKCYHRSFIRRILCKYGL
jgi:hypothetical protein